MPATLWSVRTSRDRLDSRTRAVLIASARQAFSELGYARTTVADITERADVSRATFYVYFGSKDDVFRVLTEQLRDEFFEAQLARSADEADPVAVATVSVTEFVDVYAANLAFITVLEHQALTDPHVRDLWLGIRTAAATPRSPFGRPRSSRHGSASPTARRSSARAWRACRAWPSSTCIPN